MALVVIFSGPFLAESERTRLLCIRRYTGRARLIRSHSSATICSISLGHALFLRIVYENVCVVVTVVS